MYKYIVKPISTIEKTINRDTLKNTKDKNGILKNCSTKPQEDRKKKTKNSEQTENKQK